ncbi:hypothetical protein ACTXT7_016350 [Hymenolepis weldensis]
MEEHGSLTTDFKLGDSIECTDIIRLGFQTISDCNSSIVYIFNKNEEFPLRDLKSASPLAANTSTTQPYIQGAQRNSNSI